jgi:hypothetical protein|tara:strand:+ start:4668 stop:4958 length:291 start_codon:yes stop_codon:yes gene_type:complete
MKIYKVHCGTWSDEVEVDTEIFDTEMSQCIEAMTISLSNFCEIMGWLQFELDNHCIVEWVEDKGNVNHGRRYIAKLDDILENAGKIKHLEKINGNL